MKIKFKVKVLDKIIETEREFDDSDFRHEGYSFKNELYSIANDIKDEYCWVEFEVLDGKYKGLNDDSILYETDEVIELEDGMNLVLEDDTVVICNGKFETIFGVEYVGIYPTLIDNVEIISIAKSGIDFDKTKQLNGVN